MSSTTFLVEPQAAACWKRSPRRASQAVVSVPAFVALSRSENVIRGRAADSSGPSETAASPAQRRREAQRARATDRAGKRSRGTRRSDAKPHGTRGTGYLPSRCAQALWPRGSELSRGTRSGVKDDHESP